MKFSAQKDQLLAGLNKVSRAASVNPAYPATSGVLIEAQGDNLRLSATDRELAMQTMVEASLEEEGKLLLPAKLFNDVVKNSPESSLQVSSAHKSEATLVSGSSSFKLRTLKAEDFPKLPTLSDNAKVIKLSTEVLIETIERVTRAASKDESRPILTGVYVSVEGSKLNMVATDSFRLALKHTELEKEVEESFTANVPAKALNELVRVIAGLEALEVSLALEESQLIFEAGSFGLSTRLIQGNFPNYNALIPQQFEEELSLERVRLYEVVTRMSLLAQRNTPLKFHFTPGLLTVSAETPELGQSQESLKCDYQGEDLSLGFNPAYLKDGLESLKDEQVKFKIGGQLKPTLLQPGDGENFTYLIMPVRLGI